MKKDFSKNIMNIQFSSKRLPESIWLPLYLEDLSLKRRSPLSDLFPAERKAVRQIFRSKQSLPKTGVYPVFVKSHVILIHILGKKEEAQGREVFEAGMSLAAEVKKYNIARLQVSKGSLNEKAFADYAEGTMLGSYEFLDFKKKKRKEASLSLEKIIFLEKRNQRALAHMHGIETAKNIINTPPSIANPNFMEEEAQKIEKKYEEVKLTVIRGEKLKKDGFGGIYSVGQGSQHESRLLVFEYKQGGEEKPLILVGKGVTFDTGGYNIKGNYMRWMKQDLSGAATVMGALVSIAQQKMKRNVVVLVPVAENMVSKEAYLPDDIITMKNGTTVEIVNTDAEGRLLLGDAMAYAEENWKDAAAMIDAATLTGACAYAVGDDYAAGLGNNAQLMQSLMKSAERVYEPLWELPLHQRYKKHLDSSTADIMNCSKVLKAGTIEGALFLQHFVEKLPWVHLDIASIAFDENKGLATGKTVRLLSDFVDHGFEAKIKKQKRK